MTGSAGASRRTTECFWRDWLKVALAVAIVALMVTSIGPVVSPTKAASQTTLVWGMMEAIDSLNPFIGINDNAYIFYGLIYDYLIAVDEDLNPQPNLALSWNIVPTELPYGSVWQYNITRNAVWHDGEPMTAEDVNFTINYQVGTNYATMWAYQPYTILIDHAVAKDDYTTWIYFKNTSGGRSPCPFGDKIMMPILPKHIWKDIPNAQATFSYENFKPIGTGPFKCTDNTKSEFLGRTAMVLLNNTDYHGKLDFNKYVHFDRLILKFYLEPAAMLADMETGAIDLALFNAPNYASLMKYIEGKPTAPIGTFAGLTCTSFSIDLEINMNVGAPGINPTRCDPAVREALAYAVDKEFIRDHIYKGYAEVGSTIISPIYKDLFWSPGPTEIYEYDLEKANQTLEAAGYHWNTDHTMRVSSPDNTYEANKALEFNIVIEEGLVEDKDTADMLKYDWAKIGIKLTPLVYDTGQWNTIVYSYSAPYDLTISYWSGDPDPNYLLFVETSYSIGGWSDNAYSNPRYDENYTLSVESLDPAVRKQAMINCQKIMYHDAAFMVTVYPYGCYAWRTDHFQGWGDWNLHPGRSLSNFWTANPLYFDLAPVIEPPEPTGDGAADLTLVYVGVGVAAAVVVAVAVLLLLRRRGPRQEEDVKLP